MIGVYGTVDEKEREIRAAGRQAGLALATPPDDWTTWLFADTAQNAIDLLKLAPAEADKGIASPVTIELRLAMRRRCGRMPDKPRRAVRAAAGRLGRSARRRAIGR
jgi:hypothetical protein